jgi:deoxyadenosine/deoxycytidine kinase
MANKMIAGDKMTVLVEGNTCSGKSSFLDLFNREKDAFCVINEPFEEWSDCDGYNILDLFHRDPKKWAMSFHSFITLTMLQSHMRDTEQPIKVMERSLYSMRYCFMPILSKRQVLHHGMISVLNKWYNFINIHYDYTPDVIGK